MPHLFLDLDNTLVGTEDLILPVFLDLLKTDYRIDLSEDEFYERFLGKAEKSLYRAIADHFSVTLDEDSLLLKQKEANHKAILERGFAVAPALLETLGALHRDGWIITIVSNSADDKIRATLDNMQDDPGKVLKTLAGDRIISCHLRQKPDPHGYLEALQRAQAQAGDPVVCVEDSPSGASAAVAAGLPVYGFTGFARDKDKAAQGLLATGCIAVFDHWADFTALIQPR